MIIIGGMDNKLSELSKTPINDSQLQSEYLHEAKNYLRRINRNIAAGTTIAVTGTKAISDKHKDRKVDKYRKEHPNSSLTYDEIVKRR